MAEIIEIVEINGGDEIIEVGDIILTAGYDVTDAVLVNVTNYVPLGTGEYYTLTTAIAAVPNDMRKTGLKITFAISSGVWVSYQFKGASIADWSTEANWELQGVSKKYVDDGLLLKENTVNKKTSINDSDTEFPTSKAVMTALNDRVSTSNIANNLTTTAEGSVLDARQGPVITTALDTKATHGYTGTAKTLKEVDDAKVSKTGDETVAGVKTFSSSPVIPTPTTDMQSSTKKYVDDADALRVLKSEQSITNKTLAEVLSTIDARILSLETFVKGNLGDITVNTINIIRGVNQYGSDGNAEIKASGTPAAIPDYIGQQYTDTSNGNLYKAKNNTAVADWVKIN